MFAVGIGGVESAKGAVRVAKAKTGATTKSNYGGEVVSSKTSKSKSVKVSSTTTPPPPPVVATPSPTIKIVKYGGCANTGNKVATGGCSNAVSKATGGCSTKFGGCSKTSKYGGCF